MIRPIATVRSWWAHPGSSPEQHSRASSEPPLPPPEPGWLSLLERRGIPRTLIYPTTTLGALIDQAADRFPHSAALMYGSSRWTYRSLKADVNRTAGALAGLGVRAGDRVLTMLPNCPEFITTFFAAQKLGAVVVNAGPLMGADDLRAAIQLTTPRVAIGLDLQSPMMIRAAGGTGVEHFVWVSLQFYQSVFRRLGYQLKLWQNRESNGSRARHSTLADLLTRAPARPPAVEPDPEQLALLQPTGGTTGSLRLAQLSHRNLIVNAVQVSTWMQARPGQERVLTVLPMFHVYGLTVCMLTGIYTAGALIITTRFSADQTIHLARQWRPTVFPVVPAICDAISDNLEKEPSPDLLSDVRLCMSGAAPLSAATAERFNRLTGARVVEGYGLTEAAPVTHSNLPDAPRSGSIGLPMPDTLVRVVNLDTGQDAAPGEPGEMLVCGPQIMGGYFADGDATRAALSTDEQGRAWLHTGDIVRTDADGYTFVLDRKKDMIIRSGLKVYPAKVERVLRLHKQVADAAVVGRPDLAHTERVVAAVAPAGEIEDQAHLAEELRALCREHLAPYEVPQDFEFMEKLPRSPLGKLLKRELRSKPPAREVAAVDPRPATNGKAQEKEAAPWSHRIVQMARR